MVTVTFPTVDTASNVVTTSFVGRRTKKEMEDDFPHPFWMSRDMTPDMLAFVRECSDSTSIFAEAWDGCHGNYYKQQMVVRAAWELFDQWRESHEAIRHLTAGHVDVNIEDAFVVMAS